MFSLTRKFSCHKDFCIVHMSPYRNLQSGVFIKTSKAEFGRSTQQLVERNLSWTKVPTTPLTCFFFKFWWTPRNFALFIDYNAVEYAPSAANLEDFARIFIARIKREWLVQWFKTTLAHEQILEEGCFMTFLNGLVKTFIK